jgi:hypothetical protein
MLETGRRPGVAGALWLSALLRRTRFSVEDRIAAGKK